MYEAFFFSFIQQFWIAQSGGRLHVVMGSTCRRGCGDERRSAEMSHPRRCLFTCTRPRRARLMPIEKEYDIRTRTGDGIFSDSHRGRKKKRQSRWVFGQIGFIYSAAYCLFAQLHVANARRNSVQLPHCSDGLHH